MQTSRLEKIQILLLFIASSATITILPDILTGFLFPYVGYTVLPLLLFVFVAIVINVYKIQKSLLTFVVIHFLLISLSCFFGVIHGSKSILSSSIFFGSFLIFSSSVLAMKCNWRVPFLKIYFYVSVAISLGVIISFTLDLFNLYDTADWTLENPLNEKFNLKYDKLGGSPYSYPYFLSLILTDSSKALYGFTLSNTGDFTGLSYEASLSLLFSTVGILSYLGRLRFFAKLWAFFILILHSVIGLSVTNIIGLSVVFVFLFYCTFRNVTLRVLLLLFVIITISKAENLLFVDGTIIMEKIESRSFEDSFSFLTGLFRGGFLGDGIFSLSGSLGVLPSAILIILYLWLMNKFRYLLKNGFIFQAAGLLYLIIHSLKFPGIFWQLPFSLIIISVITQVYAPNKGTNLSPAL